MRYLTGFLAAVLLAGCVASDATRKEKEAYIKENDRPPRIEQALRQDKVVTGMFMNEVKMVLGRPYTSNQSYYGDEYRVQCCYQKAGGRCFYFEGPGEDMMQLEGWN